MRSQAANKPAQCRRTGENPRTEAVLADGGPNLMVSALF